MRLAASLGGACLSSWAFPPERRYGTRPASRATASAAGRKYHRRMGNSLKKRKSTKYEVQRTKYWAPLRGDPTRFFVPRAADLANASRSDGHHFVLCPSYFVLFDQPHTRKNPPGPPSSTNRPSAE